MNEDNRLDIVEAQVEVCTKCRLHTTRKNTVFGTGDTNTPIVFIGTAPGQTEDEQGKPFVGRAGSQELNKLLESMGLKRKNVFLCNIIKCRPPGNRNPYPREITACRPYLIQQIEIIRPAVIVCLGIVSAIALLQLEYTATVKSLRGKIHDYYGIPVVVTYHPAAILRRSELRVLVNEDMERIIPDILAAQRKSSVS